MALELKPLYAAKAKKNQGARTDILQKSAKSIKPAQPIDTRANIAKVAGVSHDTIAKGRALLH